MTDVRSYTKKLCMTELIVNKYHFDNTHYYDSGPGKINSSFGFIVKGNLKLNGNGNQLLIGENSLFFIPEGMRYYSVWTGSPDIDYYGFEIVTKHPDDSGTTSYAMSKISEMSNENTLSVVKNIYELFATDDRINKLRALGMYYSFYADVLPFLKTEASYRKNPVIIEAQKFLQDNYERDFEMEELAELCHISESRLYHLFKSNMHTTPVKYRNQLRIEKACSELCIKDISISEIAEKCGFNSLAYFREVFHSFTGMTPNEYRLIKQ